MVLLSILLLGPLVTSVPLGDYARDPATRGHLWNLALYPIYYLPGVFPTNHIPHAVNGSLWSLPVEFMMYLAVPLSFGLPKLGRAWFALVFVVFATMHFLWVWPSTEMTVFWGTDMRQLPMCGIFFAAGALIRSARLERLLHLNTLVFAGVLLLAGTVTHPRFFSALWVALPLIVLGFGLASSAAGRFVATRGDYSYGIYLYAFPVQQTLLWLRPDLKFWPFLLMTVFFTGGLAWLSWHLVEQPALRLKPRKRGAALTPA